MFSFTHKRVQRAMGGASLLGSMMLAGCSANFGTVTANGGPIATTGSSSTKLVGTVHGGQQPVSGAKVQLWVAGTSGYGSAPTALGPVQTTNSNGGFTLGSYTCPSGGYLYITAAGGDPQLSSGAVTNTSLAMMSALGNCTALAALPSIQINEVTTVAAVWALNQFMSSTGTALSSTTTTPSDMVGTKSSNLQGLANSMGIAGVLANFGTGASPEQTRLPVRLRLRLR